MISRSSTLAALTALAGVFVTGSGIAGTGPANDGTTASAHAGRASVYQELLDNSLEHVTPADRINDVALGNSAPTELWQVLEHGEKVECLSCIPSVSGLLFNTNAKTREIAAWWLRRRIFGVFGPGQVYSQLLDTIKNDASEDRRAYAADALGEFLLADGVGPVAKAATTDGSVLVRTSAVRALERLNNEGPQAELATALSDQAPEVRLAALHATVRINVFSRPDAIGSLLSDDSADVRRSAAEVLGAMHSTDAVVGLIALTDETQESDPMVRVSAVGALGKIADPSAREAIEAATADTDPLVQSVAQIALRRL